MYSDAVYYELDYVKEDTKLSENIYKNYVDEKYKNPNHDLIENLFDQIGDIDSSLKSTQIVKEEEEEKEDEEQEDQHKDISVSVLKQESSFSEAKNSYLVNFKWKLINYFKFDSDILGHYYGIHSNDDEYIFFKKLNIFFSPTIFIASKAV